MNELLSSVPEKEFLKVKDIERKLGISGPTARKLLKRPGCPIIYIGRAIRVPRQAFERWLESQQAMQ